MNEPKKTFADLGLHKTIVSVLSKKEITTPTPIQMKAIPFGVKGEDVLGVARTGTGKTLAFVLPIIHQLHQNQTKGTGAALIMTPTRELATQIEETVQWFHTDMPIKSAVIVGGVKVGRQLQALKKKPQLIIATPGRLIDLLQQKELNLQQTEYIVLDEADRMLDMGFAPQIKQVLKYAPDRNKRQTMLFSATMPEGVVEILRDHMREPVHIEVAAPGTTADTVEQEILVVDREHKKDALVELLDNVDGAVIVFMRTKHHCKKLNKWLRQRDYKSEEIHGNRSQSQRDRAIEAMQKGKSRILVATDVAARGIDIPHLAMVINYDLPDDPDNYVHRIGRTGRAKREGYAISFVASDQADELQAIQKLINQQITHTRLETVPETKLQPATGKKKKKGGGGGRGRGGNSRGRGGSNRGGRGRNGGNGSNGGRNRSNLGNRSKSGGNRNGNSKSGNSRSGGRGQQQSKNSN